MHTSGSALLPIFRSEQQVRLLSHLFIHMRGPQSLATIGQQTGIPQPTISREVERLSKAGLVRSRQAGRMRLVEANDASPFYGELRSLLLKAFGPVTVLRDELIRIGGIRHAFVFGSWARRYLGESGPSPADIDLVVVGSADVDAIYAACRRVETVLGMDVNPVVISLDEWNKERSGFIKDVRQGPLVPISGDDA